VRPDWSIIAAWIGALGGLSGFATLGVTWWWRHQDRNRTETERIVVHYVTGGVEGLAFWVSFADPEANEPVEVLANVLGGGASGPFIEGHRRETTGPSYEPQRTLPPSGRFKEVVEPMARWLNTPIPEGSVGAHLIAHGTPPPTEVRVRFRIRGKASGKILASRTLHIAP